MVGFFSSGADHSTTFGIGSTTLGGCIGASGRIKVCLGCVARTGTDKMVCRG
jgi:hypothetical protein